MFTLNEKEVNFIVEAIMGQNKLGNYKKGNRFVSETQVWNMFDKDLRIFKTPVDITGVSNDYILAKKVKLNPYKLNELSKDELDTLLDFNLREEEGDLLISSKEVKPEHQNIYKKVFDTAFASYGTSVETMNLIKRTSGTKLEVKFSFENYIFTVEFPFINNLMEATVNNNLYSFSYMPLNLESYINGSDKVLRLSHPYQFLINEMLRTVGDKKYSIDIFRFMIKKSKGGTIKQFQNKINKTLLNAKETSWSEKNNCPVMWVDSFKSDLGKTLLSNNIQLNLNYMELLNVRDLKGIDLNTGSTSAPGKRCRIAKNYIVKRENGDFFLTKKEDSGNEIFDIVNDIKNEIYPCFIKTSAKRDNTATIKDTYNLVNPSKYVNRFKIIK